MKIKHFLLTTATAFGVSTAVFGQPKSTDLSWRYGIYAGANYNLGAAGYQNLIGSGPYQESFLSYKGIDGTGVSPAFGFVGEYLTNGILGFQLRVLYDQFTTDITDESKTYQDKFNATWNYLTISPLLRLNATDALYFNIGPTIALNLSGKYDFISGDGNGKNGTYDIPALNSLTYGAAFGVGYDIVTNTKLGANYLVVSPYLESAITAYQREASFKSLQNAFDDTWSTITFRAGVSIKLGSPRENESQQPEEQIVGIALITPEDGKVRVRKIDEFFPMLNYVFFDQGSTQLPARYTNLTKDSASRFTETSLLEPIISDDLNLQTQSERQRAVYYNILNIYGARMRENPSENITVIGSDPNSDDESAMANTVKNYLVNNFGIEPNRITVETSNIPRKPSGTANTPAQYKSLIDEENRRVEIVPSNPSKIGKPVNVRSLEYTPADNDLTLSLDNTISAASWRVIFSDTETGRSIEKQFYDENDRIDAFELLAGRAQASYRADLSVKTTDGRSLSYTKVFTLKLDKKFDQDLAQRYQIIFDYGKGSKPDITNQYGAFIRDEIAPRVKSSSKVLVTGHTDNIGTDDANSRVSKERASTVRDLLVTAARNNGTTLGKYSVTSAGYGKDDSKTLFKNSLPEGRHFNRAVNVTINPPKK